ncbi:aldose 1-epimerase family protein [Microbacterium saperdae]
MARIPLSGEQCVLQGHGYRAEIATVGATLRSLSHRGRPLIAGFHADRVRPAMRGALLVPWPNRTADGRYDFAGESHRLPLDEPDTRTAVHGLVAWSSFEVIDRDDESVTLQATLEPRPGYPWRLRVRAAFQLESGGLRQEITVENDSERTAPVGIGGHPYLLAGPAEDGGVDSWQLEVDAQHVLLTSAERMLPEGLVAVDERPEFDFRTPRRIGRTALNNSYTAWGRSADGIAAISLRDAQGAGVRIAWDRRCDWAHLYSSDEPVDGIRRAALAVEPMTCPPDALNSGTGLLAVHPGRSVDAGWLLSAL